VSLTDLLAAALDTHSGLWAPFPVWFIGALVFVMQMASAPSSGSKRACVALLIAWALWLVLFIVVMTLVGILGDLYGVVIVPSVMIPILFVLMIAFVIVADVAFRAAHGPVNGDLGDMRTLRGVHLGLNLAGMFIFPIFTYIGVPLTIAKIARHRRTTGCFGGTAAFGVLTLLFLTIVILVASITSGIRSDYGPIDYYNCRKRSVLQVQNSTTVTGTTTGFTTGFTTIDPTTDPTTIYATNSPATIDPTTDATTAWTWAATTGFDWLGSTFVWDTTTNDPWWTATTEACYVEAHGGAWSSMWTGLGSRIWGDYYYYSYYRTQLDEPGAIIAVVVLSLLAFSFHIVFTVLADQIILKNIAGASPGPITGVVISQVPGATAGQPLVHPCASCGTPLQFNRTGPMTQVQCYQCRAIVEFTTA
jgi:hypothetical protein